jgi:chorismate-pyruvate lyase
LNTKPLGDILFEKNIFQKDEIVFSIFSDDKKKYWGRKIKYYVKSQPLSVMEVFLI